MEVSYKIIGGDGAEYGPATLDELRNWIRDGRVSGITHVWRSDLALWSPAARYVELQPALARLHASVPESVTNQQLRPAGFWARLGAYMLDRAVLVLIFGIFSGPLAQWQHWATPVWPQVFNQQTFQKLMDQFSVYAHGAAPFLFVLIMVYEVLMNGRFGATLGKMTIGAKIICLDGSRIGYTRALLRSLAARFTELTFYWGYLLIAFRRDKRGLHDLLAGTKVVYQR